MRTYSSNDDLFLHIRDLISQLDASAHAEAAATLRDGYASLNGLTDGWAMLLEGIVSARKHDKTISPELRAQLGELQAIVRKMVYR